MGRLHFVRHESSRHFVLSLSTTFKNVNALIDAVLNGLVVGYLEMQARYKLQSTPIPTVSCLSGPRMIYKEQRCCDCLLISVSHNQMKIFWHRLAQHLKEWLTQIRRWAMFIVGVGITAIKKCPILLSGAWAINMTKRDSRTLHLRPFLTNIFTTLHSELT